MANHDPITTRKRPEPAAISPPAGPQQQLPSDETIIESVLRGEPARFAELVDRYKLFAWKLAYSFVGNFEDARELSQNAFLKAYRHLGRFRGDSRFSTWLCRIVLNECADFTRRRKREPIEALSPILEPADPKPDPRELAENKELASMISASVEKLPQQQRRAFILHHLHGLSIEETSRIMACRVGTAKAHLFRASERLRKELAPWLERNGQLR